MIFLYKQAIMFHFKNQNKGILMLHYLALPLAALLLVGCGNDITLAKKSDLPAGYALFEKSKGNIPYPNDILFAGSTDGTLNIPVSSDTGDAEAALTHALNSLDGFSTTSPISIGISGDLDASTLPGNVHLYKVLTQASAATMMIPAVGGIVSELTFGTDYVATLSNDKLLILPTKPLESHSSYMVVITNGVTNSDGQHLVPDTTMSLLLSDQTIIAGGIPYFNPDATDNTNAIFSVEGLRQITQAMIAQAQTQGIARDNIAAIWSFTTQSIGKVSRAMVAHNPQARLRAHDTNLTTAAIGAYGFADIYTGTLRDLPYYLGSENAALTTAFHDANGSLHVTSLPLELSQKTVPLLVTLPNASSNMQMPAQGWPVVIFQHGITQNRTNLLAIADALARAGYAAVAIDLPLHGIVDTQSPFYMPSHERTFDLDIINNDTGAPTPDGIIDPSGKHYLNLSNLLVARDNIRQSTSDLIALKNALASAEGVPLDASRVAFLGHSLGTIAAFGFLADAQLESTVLAMPGGGIAQFLSHSESFGQEIRDGLYAAAGIEPESTRYNQFMLTAQTILDDADAINYAADVGSKQDIFAVEVLNDATIPNTVATAPLSGTEPLLTLLNATHTIAPNTAGNVTFLKNSVARFTVGGHSSLLSPEASAEATQEMQAQIASFIGSKAAAIQVTNNTILQP
ncbi:MAG: lipase [Sulfurimonas sp.]|nr:MAG: lipase [Sulfurimonas sp.]